MVLQADSLSNEGVNGKFQPNCDNVFQKFFFFFF